MANKVLIQAVDGVPKQICFADHAADFSAPTAANDLRVTTDGSQETDVQFDFASVADAAYRQSTKFDFGADRAEFYNARGAFEFAATPVAGERVYLYLAPSHSATAGTGNPGGVSGADGAYTGYSSNAAASAKQLLLIGVGYVTAQATATVQIIEFGVFSPPERYASLVALNDSGAAMHSDAAEINIVFDPIVPEVQ